MPSTLHITRSGLSSCTLLRWTAGLAFLLAVLFDPGLANATAATVEADVAFRFSGREAWIGASLNVEIEVANASTITPPVLPTIDGATVRLLPGERSSSFTQIVNGRMTRRESRVYTIEIRPTRAGEIEIPPIEVEADGKRYQSEPTIITARKSETGDLLLAQVLADPPQIYLGESMNLSLRIVIRPYRDRELATELSEADMWSLIDLDGSSWGVFQDALQDLARQRRRPLGRAIEVDGRTYYVYDLNSSLQALRPGAPELGDISILMNYPTSLRQDRDFFGRRNLVLGGVRPLVATPESEGLEILPLPEEGRPAWFSGAVGTYDFSVAATPREVSVGDPVTITLSITDRGGDSNALSLLQPPRLEAVDELLKGFRIPAGNLAGTVRGNTKTFTQTIRPIADSVTEVPPLPFSWFDPESREYRTIWSEAIPLEVKPTETMSLSAVVQGGDRPLQPRDRGTASGDETTGLLVNVPADPRMLVDEAIDLDWRVAFVVVVPPLLAVSAILILRRRWRFLEDERFARASRARRTALRRLRDGDADAVATALAGFVADRGRLPSPTITRQEVREILEQRGAESTLIEETDEILRRCERARFGSGGQLEPGLVEQTRTCLGRLDRLRWTRPIELAAGAAT